MPGMDGGDSAEMPYYEISIEHADGTGEALGMLPFASREDAESDVRKAIPDAAADLLRKGCDPLDYAFVLRDEAGDVVTRLPFRPASTSRKA